LCWGVIGVEGFDFLIRDSADLERLHALLDRGVRVFQPVYGRASVLGGSSEPHDDRGLSDLGRAFLQTLADREGPRRLIDLAHLNPQSMSDALDWFESDPARWRRLIPVYSHGAPRHDGFVSPRGITPENLRRLRALGGWVGFSVGPPFFDSAESLRATIEEIASIPFEGGAGVEGMAIGTDFLGVDQTLPDLGNVEEVVAWVGSSFPSSVADLLLFGNAHALLTRMLSGLD
ncbi:MAG: membrane dipeptidase, partial [Isosphaeraceae bacterium]